MAATDILEIAQSGDVVLICAPSKKPAVPHKLRVSSVFLMHASPVFKALLGPKFREGNALAANSYVEVALPDDAAEPMTTMLKAVHMSRDLMNYHPKPLELLEIATVADKYDCCTAMNHTAFYWISNHGQEFEEQKVSTLTMASYCFRQTEQFRDMCNDLVMHSRKAIVAPAEAKSAGLEMLFVNLERARSRELEAIRGFLDHILASEAGSGNGIDKIGCTSDCYYEARRAQALLKEFRQICLWPSNQLRALSVKDCIHQLRDCDMEDLDDIETCCWSCSGNTFGDSSQMEIMFDDKANTIERDQIDFCLQCVREGDMSWKENQCNHSM